MDFHELSKLTVIKLREMAVQYEDIEGAAGMTKGQLVKLLCEKMGIDYHEHVAVAAGVDKSAIKHVIRGLKSKRTEALASGNRAQAKTLQRRIHHKRRKLRKSLIHIKPT
jgi:hypothetical protein